MTAGPGADDRLRDPSSRGLQRGPAGRASSDSADVPAQIRTRSARICPEMRHRHPGVRTTPRLADGSTPALALSRDPSAGIGPPPGRVLPDGRLQCYRADSTCGCPMPSRRSRPRNARVPQGRPRARSMLPCVLSYLYSIIFRDSDQPIGIPDGEIPRARPRGSSPRPRPRSLPLMRSRRIDEAEPVSPESRPSVPSIDAPCQIDQGMGRLRFARYSSRITRFSVFPAALRGKSSRMTTSCTRW
jgi:hypothetical protein